MYDLHFGLASDEVPTSVTDRLGTFLLITDGDGWNSWGEAPGTDSNDATTMHVIARYETLGAAIDAATRIYHAWDADETPLMPMTAPAHQADTFVVVTAATDWSETYLLGTARLLRTIEGTVA